MDSPTTQLNIFASAQKNAHLKIRFSHSQVTASSQRSLHYSFSLQLNKTYFLTSIKLLRLYNLIKLSSEKLTFLIGLKSIRLVWMRMVYYRLVPWMANQAYFWLEIYDHVTHWGHVNGPCWEDDSNDYWVVLSCR